MRRSPIRVYADTSVFGGILDEEFDTASRRFFDQVRAGDLRLVTSVIVQDEIAEGPAAVQARYEEMLGIAEVTEIPPAAFELQQAYVHHAVVSERWAADALHVAIATVAGCSMIVSWNFRHIVNFRRIPLYNGVNALKGYGSIAIHSPLEVLEDEEQEL